MTHIFISYSRKDKDFVYPLVERLERFFNIWIDKRDMEGQPNFDASIQKNIQEADALIAFLSPAAVESQYVMGEISTALTAKKPVLPFIYQDCNVPLPLKTIDWIQNKDEGAFEKLLKRLSTEAPMSRVHPGQPVGRERLAPDYTFGEIANQFAGSITGIPLPKTNHTLVGLPIHFTLYHALYLFGRADDTTEYQTTVQLAFQMTGDFPDNNFPQGIANHFVTPANPHHKLRLLVIRSPKSPDTLPNKPKGYGLDATAPAEWQDAVTAANYALTETYTLRPKSLQLFIKGPAVFLYPLGVEHRGFYNTELYHYERGIDAYLKVLG